MIVALKENKKKKFKSTLIRDLVEFYLLLF